MQTKSDDVVVLNIWVKNISWQVWAVSTLTGNLESMTAFSRDRLGSHVQSSLGEDLMRAH